MLEYFSIKDLAEFSWIVGLVAGFLGRKVIQILIALAIETNTTYKLLLTERSIGRTRPICIIDLLEKISDINSCSGNCRKCIGRNRCNWIVLQIQYQQILKLIEKAADKLRIN